MTTQTLTLAVALGAAAIALWLNVRFAGLAPGSMTATLVHLVCAMGCFVMMPRLLWATAGSTDAVAPKFAGVFLLFLPSMTYLWLVSIWLMRLMQGQSSVR